MIVKLNCEAQFYEWGKRGSSSKVAQYLKSANPNFSIDEEKPYAELWMGTHPKAPSKVMNGDHMGESLIEFLESSNMAISSSIPFLFKVLSISKALSIQAHPDKGLAEKLFASQPQHYPDANHKPEMAIALPPDSFEVLVGFLPRKDIVVFLADFPEFSNLFPMEIKDEFCSQKNSDNDADLIKKLYSYLMNISAGIIEHSLKLLLERLSSKTKDTLSIHELLVLRISSQFPGDIGIFSLFFLNYLRLNEGEAVYLSSNVLHAYLSGNCLELMATSDNVVRAGLTPKHKDVQTLLQMLNYEPSRISSLKVAPIVPQKNEDEFCTSIYYEPEGITEFGLCLKEFKKMSHTHSFITKNCHSLLFVIEGEGAFLMGSEEEELQLFTGQVFYISPSTSIRLKSLKSHLKVSIAYSRK